MTSKLSGRLGDWSAVRNSVAGVAVAVCMAVGSAGTAGADPSLVPTPTPTPTVTVEGGAAPTATATATTAATATAAAGATSAAAAATGATSAAAADPLDELAEQYAVGSGGGQLSNLLRVSLKLRSMGYKPSKQYLDELRAAMKYRPNQLPLIDALKDTIAYQQKLKAQMDILSKAQSQQNSGAVMGAGQMPAASNPAGLAPQPGAPAAAGAPAAVPPAMPPTP